MIKKVFIASFLLLPFFVEAQDFKPLIDPTKACSYTNPNKPEGYKTDYFFIVEEMPRPSKTLSSIEKLLNKKVTHLGIPSGTIVFQTLINCQGQASDYQLLSCNSPNAILCRQVLEVFQEDVAWEAGIQRNRNVDVLVKVAVKLEQGQFKITNR